MAKIETIIQAQNFEIIRDRIGAVLYTEIKNQLQLSNNNILECDVFVERNTPVDKVEVPTIIISLASGNYDSKNQSSVRGTYEFFVDVYTSAISNNASDGAVRATFALHRILGMCRYVLEHPAYKTLDFANPLISHTSVKSMNIRQLNANDAVNTAMGRLAFTIVANEDNGFQCACDLADYYSSVKIDTSNDGFVYITEQTA